MNLLRQLGPKRHPLPAEGCRILLTGTFYSENWAMAHLRPLSMSKQCARLSVVSIYTVPAMDKVEAIYPPTWLIRVIGPVSARLLTFIRVGFLKRPHIVGASSFF